MNERLPSLYQALLAAYDLTPPVELVALPRQVINNDLVGVRTGNGDFLLKLYKPVHNLASLEYEHRLLGWLDTQQLSFSVPALLACRDGTLLCRKTNEPSSLCAWLPGSNPDPANLAHVEAMGAALGELNTHMPHYPLEARPGRVLFAALFEFPPPEYNPFTLAPEHLGLSSQPDADQRLGWWREQATKLQDFVDGVYRTLPWHVCHNDITPANTLLSGERITAILDFEFACPAPRALDLAMGLRMTMRAWENPEPWEAARRFLRGYTRYLPVTEAEIAALPQLILLRSAIPILWRLRRMEQPEDAQTVLRGIGFLQNAVRWFGLHKAQFLDTVAQANVPSS